MPRWPLMSSHVNKVELTVAEIAVKFISQTGSLLCLMQATKGYLFRLCPRSNYSLCLFVCLFVWFFKVEISLVT